HPAQKPPSEFLPAEPGIQTERLVAHKVRSTTQRFAYLDRSEYARAGDLAVEAESVEQLPGS
ncbi:hypothetical protein, partial [Streptomyces sp. NPDC058572]|uniref:hypothetical protein n=1 Tax=Streptomyces sp. NPDC058572 TaxID=3346546 RepID=UPI0036594842